MADRYASGSIWWLEGDLTKASMLYEGAFEEWWSHLESVWRIRDNVPQRRTYNSNTIRDLSREETTSVTELCHSVSPTILRRVPAAGFRTLETLFPALETASQPFRFLDLPIDIRLHVYDYISLDLDLTVDTDRWEPGRVPPILGCSKQIRQEVLPMVGIELDLEAHIDVFKCGHLAPGNTANSTFRDFAKQLTHWSLGGGSEFVSNLSRISLTFEEMCETCRGPCSASPGIEFEIDFAYNSTQGLYVRGSGSKYYSAEGYWGCPAQDALSKIKHEVATLDIERRTCGLGGSALILLITKCLPKWKFLILEENNGPIQA